ncbi:MAG: cadherin-like beta sandwich domain-containing protein, partial [Cohnella sp.]|nr:cadherin-like beta sandwich domain-containing protein [Cohnella sp.]
MRKFIMTFIAFLLLALPINGAFTNIAGAASTRVAVVKELKGTAKVKKAGGSKEFTAFVKMSLNEGDVLSVGSGGSAVLQFANGTSEDDKMTVSANTKLSFSKLSNKKGSTTKVSMWSGNAWVDVKSIASANDEFTLETPTAVMGVRGTHFFVSVNTVTGATSMSVAAGVVRTSTNAPSGGPVLNVYPTQQVVVTPDQQGQADLLKAPIDINQIVSQSSPEIIKAFLQSAQDIVAENKALMDSYLSQMSADKPQQEKDRVRGNIENVVGAVASNVEKQSKLKEMQDLIAELERLLGRDVSGLDLSLSNEDNALLSKINDRLNTLQKQAGEKQRQEQLARDKELQAALLKKQEDQKKAAEEAIKKNQVKAYEKYESQLDQLEKERLKRDKDRLESNNTASPSPATSGGSGSPSSPIPTSSESPSPTSSESPSPTSSETTPPSSLDAKLASLRLITYAGESSPPAEPTASAGTIALTPTFDPTITSYAGQAASNVSYVKVKPVAANASATVTVKDEVVASGSLSGWIPLTFGNNEVTIVVTAADGMTTKTYTVQIRRIGSERLIEFDGLNLTEPFDPEVFEYTGEVDNDYIVARAGAGASVSVKLNGSSVPTYEASFMYKPLYAVGDNVLEVTVTPEIGTPVTYTFHVLNANVVKVSSLVLTTVYPQQVDSRTYSGVIDSSVTGTNLSVYTKVPGSLVEVSFNGTTIDKEISGYYSLSEHMTDGWNIFRIRVSDTEGRVPARDYELQLWKGNAALAAVQGWTVTDNNGHAGGAESYSDDWDIWYLPGADSLTIKPLMDPESPFTVQSIEKNGVDSEIASPASDGTFHLRMDNSSYTYGTVWLKSEDKLIKKDISFKPDNADFVYGLKRYGESDSHVISDTETTSFGMPAESAFFKFKPVFNSGTGGRVFVYDGEVPVLPLDEYYSIPYSGAEKTFRITYTSYGGLTHKEYEIK